MRGLCNTLYISMISCSDIEENGALCSTHTHVCTPQVRFWALLSLPLWTVMAAWQMYWPTFSGRAWRIFLSSKPGPRGRIVPLGCLLPTPIFSPLFYTKLRLDSVFLNELFSEVSGSFRGIWPSFFGLHFCMCVSKRVSRISLKGS